MNRRSKVSLFIMVLMMFAGFVYSQESAQSAAKSDVALKVTKMAVGTGVENRELQGEAQVFPVVTEKVFCFLDASGISADMEVAFVWFHNGKEVNRAPITLKAGSRWRTWAVKALYGKKGDWKVELQDSAKVAIGSAEFKVE